MNSSYSYSYTTNPSNITAEDAGAVAAIMGFFGAFWILWVAIMVFIFITNWKIFTKAGKKGWYSLIPFLNTYTLAEICGIKGWIGIVAPFCSLVPFVGSLVTLAFTVYLEYCLAKVYGKETAFALGLIFLGPIFLAILAFGDAKYLGAGASPAKTTFMASEDAAKGAKASSSSKAEAKKDEWVEGKEA